MNKNNNKKWRIDYKIKPFVQNIKIYEYIKPIDTLINYYKDVNYFKNVKKMYEKNNKNTKKYLYINDDGKHLDTIMYYYTFNFEKILILNIWPSCNIQNNNFENFIKILEKHGKIHCIKENILNKKQATIVFFQIYLYINNDITEIKRKVTRCGWNNGDNKKVIAILFEPDNYKDFTDKNSKMKKQIGEYLKKNCDTKNIDTDYLFYINENFNQTIDLMSIYFNLNSKKIFNKIILDRFVKLFNSQNRRMTIIYKNWLYKNIATIDTFRFIIFSSYILFILGLRSANDLDIIVYHNPKNAKTKDFDKILKKITRERLFNFMEITSKGYGGWEKGGEKEYLDVWFLKEWPNLFGASNIEEMIFNPQFHFFFFGLKILTFEADLVRRQMRTRPAAYANIIAARILLNKNIEIPQIPETYWKEHKLYSYKNKRDKLHLIYTIISYLRRRYHINMSPKEIALYLHENPANLGIQ